jgi:hypothetical protein
VVAVTALGRGSDGKIRRRAPVALPDIVTIVVSANRETGKVDIDAEFSTPLETENILRWALERQAAILEKANELDDLE